MLCKNVTFSSRNGSSVSKEKAYLAVHMHVCVCVQMCGAPPLHYGVHCPGASSSVARKLPTSQGLRAGWKGPLRASRRVRTPSFCARAARRNPSACSVLVTLQRAHCIRQLELYTAMGRKIFNFELRPLSKPALDVRLLSCRWCFYVCF